MQNLNLGFGLVSTRTGCLSVADIPLHNYSGKLPHLQFLINCRYSVAQLCTRKIHTLAHFRVPSWVTSWVRMSSQHSQSNNGTIQTVDSLLSTVTIRCSEFLLLSIWLTDKIVCYLNGGLNSETFDYRTHIHYLNIELFHSLDSNCCLYSFIVCLLSS